jgi:hypothetical protein
MTTSTGVIVTSGGMAERVKRRGSHKYRWGSADKAPDAARLPRWWILLHKLFSGNDLGKYTRGTDAGFRESSEKWVRDVGNF